MRVLVISNLFPNALEPSRGLFNKQQLLELAKLAEVQVVAPVPWVPAAARGLSARYARMACVPLEEDIEGLRTLHPRYLVTPKLGRSLYAWWMFRALREPVRQMRRSFPFEVILATWAYPDVVAAAWLARELRVPLIAKVHGSDINLLARGVWRWRLMVQALQQAEHLVAVSQGLKDRLLALGLDANRIHVVPNGVDVTRFRPLDQQSCRRQLGLPPDRRRIVFIGHLVPVKGLDVLLEALKRVPDDVKLSLVGEGAGKPALEARLRANGLGSRVDFAGARGHEEIPLWMNAADVVCLPSRSEGCPNVVLEALACGTPVVATRVGAIPDLIQDGRSGLLVHPEDAHGLAQALTRSLDQSWSLEHIRGRVAERSWRRTAEALLELLASSARPQAS